MPRKQYNIIKGGIFMAKYKCLVCGAVFESEDHDPQCPVCKVRASSG